ncbi:hypothetical protein ACI65C_011061 [Semiaphis heraclei]
MNTFLVFSTIVIIFGGECFQGINAHDNDGNNFAVETKNFSGMWYAVMATKCSEGNECNIFTANYKPCNCISALFRPLQEDNPDKGWIVHMNGVNNNTLTLTVDVGGAAPANEDDSTIRGFIYSRATMPLSVVTASECSITENVIGQKFFLRYRITIIGSNVEHRYMITTMSAIDKDNKDIGNPLTVVWCHVRTPGKDTIWRRIVLHFKNLNLDIHDLEFINQIGCEYPTEKQYDEMQFC